MEEISVRAMVLGDIEEIMKIEKLCFTVPWSRLSFQREIKENMLAKYFIVELEGSIVGYGGMWIIIDEAHITNIAIHPEFRGRNLGGFLLKSMIEYAKNINVFKMTLEVRRSNEAARGLYRKFGFKDIGVRPRYYSDNNEDAIIMWKEA